MLIMSQDSTIIVSAEQAVFFLEIAAEGVLLKAKVGSIEYPLSNYMKFEQGQRELQRIFNWAEHSKPAVQICGKGD